MRSRAQNNREMASVMFDTIVMRADSEPVKDMCAEAQKYATLCRVHGANHMLCTPHLHIWAALINSVAALDMKIGAANAKALKDYGVLLGNQPQEEVGLIVRQCRLG